MSKGAGGKDIKDGVEVAASVVRGDDHDGMHERQEEQGDTSMTAIVEQGKELPAQPAQRPNAKDDVQQDKCRRRRSADNENFWGNERKPMKRDEGKSRKEECHATDQGDIVPPLLAVPLDGLV